MTTVRRPTSLPPPIALPLRAVPAVVHTGLLAKCCNHLIAGQPIAARLSGLDGKRICLRILDLDLNITLQIRGDRLRPCHADAQWDARISGPLLDFVKLATRREDPDTLFFNRRLALEGDTETGLHVKNLLDAMDFDWGAHLRAHLGPTPANLLLTAGRMLPRGGPPNPFHVLLRSL